MQLRTEEEAAHMKHREKHLDKCIQLNALPDRLKAKLKKRKNMQTYKDIHKHMLQGHLYVLKSCWESHRSADQKKPHPENQVQDPNAASAAFSLPLCY